jgi:hypothetical protein
MARGKTAEDLSTLQMALVGYEIERRKIEERISEIRAQLKGRNVIVSASASVAADGRKTGAKRVLSPAARKRIAAAQKRRWAEHHKRQAMAAKAE